MQSYHFSSPMSSKFLLCLGQFFLNNGNSCSVIAYGDVGAIIVNFTAGSDLHLVQTRLSSLSIIGGVANTTIGLSLAIKMLDQTSSGSVSAVVLISQGQETTTTALLSSAKAIQNYANTELIAIGVGDNANILLLNKLATFVDQVANYSELLTIDFKSAEFYEFWCATPLPVVRIMIFITRMSFYVPFDSV